MNATLLHAVVRVADTRTPDADLLARFTANRDGAAFEELLRRHGPLVWAVCRQLLPHHADAEDAFQAVFLALVRSAGSIRAGRTLPAWLHAVAVRVAAKVKRAAARRRQREQRAAVPEADRPVPDAAWVGLMTAVHEEVQRLPDAERTAFVLCDLEGVRQPDAAARLGWPLGTLSGRLCKARQRLLDQLTRRGIASGVLALGGLAASAGSVPAALVEKVTSFPVAAATGVSSTVAALARGLVEGATMRTKLLAAGLLVAGALGLTGGAIILSKADAQTGGGGGGNGTRPPSGLPGGGGSGGGSLPPGSSDAGGGGAPPGMGTGLPGTGADPLRGGGGPPRADAGMPGMPAMPGMAGGWGVVAGGPTKWEYKFVDLGTGIRENFEKEITKAGNDGWEFCGSERLNEAKGGPAALVLVFKRAKGGNVIAGGGMMGPGMGMPGGGMPGGGGGFGGGGGGSGGMGGGGGGRFGGGGMEMRGGGADQNLFHVFKLKNVAAEDVVTAAAEGVPRCEPAGRRREDLEQRDPH